MPNGIINAGGTHQLTYDNSLRTIDYKGSGLCHQGKITHKYFMLTDFFFFLIVEADSNRQRRCIGSIPFLAFLNRIFNIVLAQLKVHKFKAKGTAVICDRRDIIKNLFQSLVKKPLIGILLDFDQIGHLQNLFLPCVTHTHHLGAGSWTYSVFLH